MAIFRVALSALAIASGLAVSLRAPLVGEAALSLSAGAGAAGASAVTATFPIDCSNAVIRNNEDYSWLAVKYPSGLSWAGPVLRRFEFITCVYSPPAVAGGIALPNMKVTLLLNFDASGAYKGGFLLSTKTKAHAWGTGVDSDLLKAQGFRLDSKTVSPVGAAAVPVKTSRSELKLRVHNKGKKAAKATEQAAFAKAASAGTVEILRQIIDSSVPKVLYICTGNTGRSPVAAALAFDALAKANAGSAFEVYSRAMTIGEETTLEAEVATAVQASAPYLFPRLNEHEAKPVQFNDYAGAYLVLVVSDKIKAALLASLEENDKKPKIIAGPATKVDYKTKVFTIPEFVGEKTDIADPYNGESA